MTSTELTLNHQENAWWFIIANQKIVLQPQGDFIPYGCLDDLPFLEALVANKIKIGEYHSSPCYLVTFPESVDVGLGEYAELRFLMGKVDELLFNMAGRAFQLDLFYRTHQYCGQCGAKMHAIDWEIAMKCYSCQHRCYPRISPCIIVGIRKGRQILLALHKRHKKNNQNIYTVLAGFTEAGETLESCIEREVYEESSLKIKNIEYIRSQPWPFPHSLMMAYLAEYDSGEIKIDSRELSSAAWYDIDNLPLLPGYGTVARELIDELIKRCN